MKKSIKKKTWLSLFFFFFIFTQSANANKFDFLAGAFSFAGDETVSNLGAYHMGYATDFKDFEVAIGYTLLMTQIVGGDLAFGFDLGINYYPWTESTVTEGASSTSYFSVNPLWRPFIGASFNQRQFQSTKSNYAGFSLCLGAERALDYSFDLKSLLRITSLAGPSSASATEITVLIGITFP